MRTAQLKQSNQTAKYIQSIKRLLVSGFVIVTFVFYAIRDHLSGSDSGIGLAPTTSSSKQTGSSNATPTLLPPNVGVNNRSGSQQGVAFSQSNQAGPAQTGLRDGQYVGD